MSRFLRALAAIWRVALAVMIQYRGEVMLWALWGIIYPAVALTMWSAAIGDAGDIRGYDRRGFAAYFLVTMICGHVCAAWDAYEFGHLVRSGALSPRLLRPILPMWSSLAENLAYKTVTLTILIPLWLAVAWVTHPHFSTTPGQLLLGMLSLVLGALIAYVWGYNIALLAFWTTRTDAIGEFWFGGSLLLGGRLAPLALLPTPLKWLAACLPFQWVVWFPAQVLIGKAAAEEIALGLLAQVGWLAGGVAVFRITWRRGLRQYSAVGA
ncbi:hypothetical protein RAS1_30810 [Phycisphaerae bacterium RAS1]|nr:hypothetical protein RAS1_30810 [Phycisphaerae bacterium RAS1]